MEREYAEYLIKKIREDYNLIAEDFSRTRAFVPEEFKKWVLQYIFTGEKVLDWGCGNGRFYEIFAKMGVDYFGVDVSEKLIKIAKKQYSRAKFQVISSFNLPFPDNFFDKILSIAVFHHIPSQEFRLKFLKEARRVLKTDGILILTVWNLNPLRMVLIGEWKRFLSFLRFSILKILGKSKLDFRDFYIPWRNLCQRYVHCFSKGELEDLAKESGFKIEEIGVLKSQKTKESNIYLIAKK
jgi:ubiquinone/menaquinone biosynthesis C-methylase UbiE